MERPSFYRLPSGVPRSYSPRNADVFIGTPSEGQFRCGDTILKVDNSNVSHLTHHDAQQLIKNAGNALNITVFRGDSTQTKSGATSCVSRATKPPVIGGVPTPFSAATASATLPRSCTPTKFSQALLSPVESLPVTALSATGHPLGLLQYEYSEMQDMDRERITITHQPYRTTPLVSPGAKVKRDIPLNNTSYLRHHPNPFFGSTATPADEALMKHKVAESVIQRVTGQDENGKQVVHKQFNSPIGLYSGPNIEAAIHDQTGIIPPRTPHKIRIQGPVSLSAPVLSRVKSRDSQPTQAETQQQFQASNKNKGQQLTFDPMKSETFRAVYEDEINQIREQNAVDQQPYKPKVIQQPKTGDDVGKLYLNTLGTPNEKIQQSYSFRRVMEEVLGECEF